MPHTIESLMRKLEAKRREERIAALTEKASPFVMWEVTPQPNACPRCREFAAHTYAEKPELPHPNCKCRIKQQEKEQKEEVQKRYYVIGRRPIKGLSSTTRDIHIPDKDIYKDQTRDTPSFMVEHQQFFDSEGNNFGFFDDSLVQPDSKSMLPEYIFGDVKFDADIIDEARVQYEQDKNTIQKIIKDFGSDPLYNMPNFDLTEYNLINNNCQDYINQVLKRARRIAKEKNIPLVLP